jgi:gliding motility associated protien GldN
MRKNLLILASLIALAAPLAAQTVEQRPNDFYAGQDQGYAKPQPFPYIRESDIVWSTELWKTITADELFNQFFYFPEDEYHTYGKKSLAYIIWDAMAAGEIPIYEDDDLQIPIDNEAFVERYTRPDTIQLEIGYDEDDNELFETIIRPKSFDGAEIFSYALRETWFIGRQDSRQDSRRIALAPLKETYRELLHGEAIPLGIQPLFWVPMQHPAVRNLLVRYTAYIDPNNVARQPSWDWIFINQYYDAYVTRESNPYNRKISDYVTGKDAIIEAAIIEDKVFDIENSMWEY